MKRLLFVICLLAAALPAMGEGTATMILWPGWNCASTEDLSLGKRHTSFPMTYLFDGDPATPWVFSGTGKHAPTYGRKGYGLHLSREEGRKPVMMDSIRIMNGYNKSQALFLRNNRITGLKLYVNGKLLKAVNLTDSMGWHKISIPRQSVSEIYMQFTTFVKGRDNDVCVSELALYDRGNKIDFRMPQVVEYTEGDTDCGCGQEFWLTDRKGRRLRMDERECENPWSPGGRYIAGVNSNGQLWVMDAATGKLVLQRSVIASSAGWASLSSWKDDHRVIVDIARFRCGKKDPDNVAVSTKTIVVRKS